MSLSLTHVIYNFFEVKYTNVVLVSLMLMSSLHVDQIEKGTSKKKNVSNSTTFYVCVAKYAVSHFFEQASYQLSHSE